MNESVKTVLLVGTGGIGSRLLQSLVKLGEDQPLTVICVDPSEESRTLAAQRISEAGGDPASEAFKIQGSLAGVPAEVDLAIVATPSKPRFAIVKDLLGATRPARLLLEKFLFTQQEAYGEVQRLCDAAGIPVWVHAPRPAWPGYEALAAELGKSGAIDMRVVGSNWAMASNAIHFIAAFQKLVGWDAELSFDASGLDAESLQNKREGYLEVSGQLTVRTPRGDRLELVSFATGALPIRVDVNTPHARYRIDEAGNSMAASREDKGWTVETHSFEMLRASEMKTVLSNLLNTGECTLPTYASMVAPHLELMKIFNGVFFGPGHELDDCPVT